MTGFQPPPDVERIAPRGPGLASMPVCPSCTRRINFGTGPAGCRWRPHPTRSLWMPGCQTLPIAAPRYPDPEYAAELSKLVSDRLKRPDPQPTPRGRRHPTGLA